MLHRETLLPDDQSQAEALDSEMTETNQSGTFKALSAARRGKLGQCTRKMNEIKTSGRLLFPCSPQPPKNDKATQKTHAVSA